MTNLKTIAKIGGGAVAASVVSYGVLTAGDYISGKMKKKAMNNRRERIVCIGDHYVEFKKKLDKNARDGIAARLLNGENLEAVIASCGLKVRKRGSMEELYETGVFKRPDPIKELSDVFVSLMEEVANDPQMKAALMEGMKAGMSLEAETPPTKKTSTKKS